MEHIEKKVASLESLLFIHGEPISHKKIETVLTLSAEERDMVVTLLKKQLEADNRGLQLVVGNDKVQLATKPEFNTILESFVREELSEELTPASLEALAIIAYLGPISRARIEYLRGVNSLVILRSLLLRGLVERIPDPAYPSGFLYQTTFDLMKQLGLQRKDDLPEFETFQDLLKVFDEKQNAS